jgi:amidohydrolase
VPRSDDQEQPVDLRALATRTVDEHVDLLVGLSHAVHGDAEIGYEEHTSAGRVADVLEQVGFEVTRGWCGLDTAIHATTGTGMVHLGIVVEYDALPGIGHACGHNVIAAAGVGAAIALAPLAETLDATIRVIGTPAEEGGGGKIHLLERGGFDGVHAALMVHPAPYDAAEMPCLAVRHFGVRYHGRAAHASASPQDGINAADALTIAQVAIGLLRQHLPTTARVHGIVTHGGDAANVVPASAEGRWFVRAPTLLDVERLYPRILRCFEAGALATGAELEVLDTGPVYAEMRVDDDLTSLYVEEAGRLGRGFPADGGNGPILASTDMGNVSLAIPSIHPLIGLDTAGAQLHEPEFADRAITASADRAVRDGAVALACTAIGAATTPTIRDRLLASTYHHDEHARS